MPSARRCRLLAALGFATLTAAAATTPAAAQQRDAAGGGFPGRDRIAELLDQNLPAGDAVPIEDVIRFGIRGNDLSVASGVKPDVSGSRPIRLRGLPGDTRVQVGTRFRGPMGLVPFFDLNHTRYAPCDGSVLTETRVQAQGDSVRIERRARAGDATTSVTFSQGTTFSRRGRFEPRPDPRVGGAAAGAAERVRLRVRESPPPANGMPDGDAWEASTFDELLRKYPGPVARYLGPLFREFGQDEQVFHVDARLAWQLFPDAVEADATTSAAITALVERLDSDDFRARERATAGLEALGGPAMIALGEIDRRPLSPEQNTRIDAILTRYSQLEESEAAALLDDAEFLLRCFTYSDLQPIRAAAAKALAGKLAKDDLGLDPAAKLPDRVRAADAVRERFPPSAP